ncbi:hypothetical protein BDV95DRAFT_603483 [Massariosphaeria phaeospora]|uniref:Rhodopsin domain-containing protein n=1 Tax=Massariosphaeria phaeospora TaxID=100035 RepID=A0A7C8MJB1_9PLEO|nr:hypothetical protein BDV95DRAFT_603483 [Massariosphaeria phaeospora]
MVELQVPILVVCALSVFIATFAIACRVLARVLTHKPWQANDWLMLGAYLATLGMLVNAMVFVFRDYYGVHTWDIPLEDRLRINRHPESRFILTTFTLSASVFCNLSITVLYMTLFPHRRFLIMCRVMLVLVAGYWLTFFIVQFFSCPRPKGPNRVAMAAKCAENIRTIWVSASVIGMLLDLANLLLPMPILWKLQMALKKKARLIVLFGLGFFIVGLTAVRICLYRKLDAQDWTYHTGRIILWSGAEPALGILAGCLPIMSPCFRFASNKLKSSFKSTGISSTKASSQPDQVHPPTIGAAKRFSIRGMGMSISATETNAGFSRIENDGYPLTTIGTQDGNRETDDCEKGNARHTEADMAVCATGPISETDRIRLERDVNVQDSPKQGPGNR